MTRDYIVERGRPVAVEVDVGVPEDAIKTELARIYGGSWRVGKFIRRGRRRRATLEETRTGRANHEWFKGARL